MSAWYVFAALGIYPVTPGVGGFALNSPLFASATVHLGNGHLIRIDGENVAADSPYIQNLKVDGKVFEHTWLDYDSWRRGAKLQFVLGQTPNKQWGTNPQDAPPSYNEGSATKDH